MAPTGQIVILNGVPRSGKSSIAAAIQDSLGGVWMNLGVDAYARVTPKRFFPGIGLRPGGKRADVEALVPQLYDALYDSIAAHSRNGLNVVADVRHHEGYSSPLGILRDCARRLKGLPVLFVGVRCPIEIIMERRNADPSGAYAKSTPGDPVPEPVRRWQEAVHTPGIYDLEVDTSVLSAAACAERIKRCLEEGARRPTAFERLAGA